MAGDGEAVRSDRSLRPEQIVYRDEAMVVVDQLFGPAAGKPPREMSYDFIPTAVFTHPNIGTVGYSEAQAREKFGDVTIFRSEFKALKHTLSGSTERKGLLTGLALGVRGQNIDAPGIGLSIPGFGVVITALATASDANVHGSDKSSRKGGCRFGGLSL